jgi:DNA-binding CsgD family transcriptional regulator
MKRTATVTTPRHATTPVDAGVGRWPTLHLVGRADELVAVRALVDDPEPRMRSLVVEGEAGIGKTAVWRVALQGAANRHLRVLVASPGEHESALPYAGLGDLLEGVPPTVLGSLPEVHAEVLDRALGRARSVTVVTRLATSRATLAVLRALSDAAPLLVAIDDVQWLDPPSASVLEFAFRRLVDAPIRVLLARRSGRPDAAPLGLDRVQAGCAPATLRLGPLGAADLGELIAARLGLRLSRPALIDLERITGGNAYFALEIAPSVIAGGEVVVPPTLTAALSDRIVALPPGVRDALLVAATSIHGTMGSIERALGGDSASLAEAVARGLIDVDGPRLRFTHPLLASVARQSALPAERRAAHRRLADATTDHEEQAIHLARGAEGIDADLAARLEATADMSATRGAPAFAAELALAAARLTPPGSAPDVLRRTMVAAEHLVAAGDPTQARVLLGGRIAETLPGSDRAGLLLQLAGTIGDSIAEPIRLCEQALAECSGDARLASRIHTSLGVYTWIAGDLARSVTHCREAGRLAHDAGDEVREAIAIGETSHAEAILGLPWDRTAMERAIRIERCHDDFPPGLRPSFGLAVISLVTDDLATARPLFEAELDRSRRAADEPGVFHVLWRLAELDLRSGDWAAALAVAREAVALARTAGIEQEQGAVEMILAAILAHVGDLAEARRLATHARESAVAGGDRAVAIRSAGVLGFADLSAGQPEAALVWLSPARREVAAMGIGELSVSAIVQNEIEALVAVGSLDEAEAVSSYVDGIGRRSGRTWHLAVAARGRALVASARGDVAGARSAIDEALAAHASLPQPFELGRTLLAQGSIERRAKQRAAAREALTAALDVFDRLGAARWSERAAAELARVPGRARRSGAKLTETERRVAELAAEGLSNKEIAARMFVTVRAVEANLTRAYRALGVDSRIALLRALERED